MGEIKHTPWEEAADQLCGAVEKRIESTARKAAESLYESLLCDTQSYLRENALLNLQSELDSARRAEADAREALRSIAAAAGVTGHSYASDTAEAVVGRIERLKAASDAAPVMKEAIEALLSARDVFEEAAMSEEYAALRAALAKANGEAGQ